MACAGAGNKQSLVQLKAALNPEEMAGNVSATPHIIYKAQQKLRREENTLYQRKRKRKGTVGRGSATSRAAKIQARNKCAALENIFTYT